MSKAVKDRLVQSFAAQGLGQVINIVIQLISVPLFLHAWGQHRYGEWLLLSTVPAYLALSDLGFGTASANDMTLRVAAGDRDGALRAYQSTWVAITVLTLFIGIVSAIVVPFLPLASYLHLTQTTQSQAVAALLLLVAQALVSQQYSVTTAGYRCDGNYALATYIGNCYRAIEICIVAACLLAGGSLVIVALSGLLAKIVYMFFLAADVHRRNPWLYVGWQHARWETIRSLAWPAFSFLGFPVGYALSLQGMVMVVGVALGPTAVVVFSTSRTLTRFVWQLLGAIANAIWVELSVALGKNDMLLARRLHRRACQTSLWLAVFFSALLGLTGSHIFRVWTKGAVGFDAALFGGLLVLCVSNSLWSSSYVVPMANNRHQQMAAVFVGIAVLSIALASVLVHVMALLGVAIALLVTDLLMNVYVIRASLKLLGDDFHGFVREVGVPPFKVVARMLRKPALGH